MSFPFGALIPVLFGARHKRHAKAARFLTGGKSAWLNTSTLLTAAGLAAGAYEIYRSSRPASSTSTVVPDPLQGPPRGATSTSTVDFTADAPRRLLQLALSAARADGTLDEEEYGRILAEARRLGLEPFVSAEMKSPRALAEIVQGFADPRQKEDAYVLAFTIVRADEDVRGAERVYLAQLASKLGLDAVTTERLERATAERIDASE
ncbi:MAG: DUF533 domain-containing protein [Planctomycetota bacterium]